MKKVLFSLLVIAGLVSCETKSTSTEPVATDSTAVVVDSTKVDTTVVAPAEEVKVTETK